MCVCDSVCITISVFSFGFSTATFSICRGSRGTERPVTTYAVPTQQGAKSADNTKAFGCSLLSLPKSDPFKGSPSSKGLPSSA